MVLALLAPFTPLQAQKVRRAGEEEEHEGDDPEAKPTPFLPRRELVCGWGRGSHASGVARPRAVVKRAFPA
jgi:hypothetical protein